MKINCGGFKINENDFELNGETLSLKNGGGGLPEVTLEDNGDVLTVVNGAWAKAAPSGGGGALVVHVDATGTLDKTWQEIYDAGFAVMREDQTHVGMDQSTYYLIVQAMETEDGFVCVFAKLEQSGIIGQVFVTETSDGYPIYFDGGSSGTS